MHTESPIDEYSYYTLGIASLLSLSLTSVLATLEIGEPCDLDSMATTQRIYASLSDINAAKMELTKIYGDESKFELTNEHDHFKLDAPFVLTPQQIDNLRTQQDKQAKATPSTITQVFSTAYTDDEELRRYLTEKFHGENLYNLHREIDKYVLVADSGLQEFELELIRRHY